MVPNNNHVTIVTHVGPSPPVELSCSSACTTGRPGGMSPDRWLPGYGAEACMSKAGGIGSYIGGFLEK